MKKHFMEKHPVQERIVRLLWLGLLTAGFLVLYYFSPLKPVAFAVLLRRTALVFAAVFLAALVYRLFRKKNLFPEAFVKAVLRIASAALALAVVFHTGMILAGLAYQTTEDTGLTTDFFTDKDVMIVVPHQDDEINLMGGMIEQYTGCGSRVSVVFSTNGDFFDLAPTRYREALEVLEALGVRQENVFFLGFGDKWQPQQCSGATVSHVYNSPDPESIWTSANNRTATYGTALKDCWSTLDYTRDNYVLSLKTLIQQRKPEIIYCVDHDEHIEHKALDLLFEETMGLILKEDAHYKPVIYKGFCYGTAWKANDDFTDAPNLLSTKKPDEVTWWQTGAVYRWEDRVRIPMAAGNLNRMLSQNSVYRSFAAYASQEAYYHSSMVLNGDKVFWERKTDSLLYNAVFTADNQPVETWNDFKWKDSRDISAGQAPWDGVFGAEYIRVELPEPAEMCSLVLYDHPDPEINILGGCIVFDDGDRVDFGPLNPGGDGTLVTFPEKKTAGFQIQLTRWEGTGAGFSEIEAYGAEAFEKAKPQYLMAVDAQDNFVYDYWIPSGDQAGFTLYSYPGDALSWEEVDISFRGEPGCSYRLDGEKLLITCPRDSKAVITLQAGERLSATFSVENPGQAVRTSVRLLQLYNRQFFYSLESLKAKAAGLLR